MAQAARSRPLPDSGRHGPEESDWIHELTPTVSDESMFDDDGPVKPLQVWPLDTSSETPRPTLKLVRVDSSSQE